jgi:hypothetical protein
MCAAPPGGRHRVCGDMWRIPYPTGGSLAVVNHARRAGKPEPTCVPRGSGFSSSGRFSVNIFAIERCLLNQTEKITTQSVPCSLTTSRKSSGGGGDAGSDTLHPAPQPCSLTTPAYLLHTIKQTSLPNRPHVSGRPVNLPPNECLPALRPALLAAIRRTLPSAAAVSHSPHVLPWLLAKQVTPAVTRHVTRSARVPEWVVVVLHRQVGT